MVRRVRFPEGMGHLFTHNQKYGWPDSIQYSPSELKERREKKKQRQRQRCQSRADALVIEATLAHFVPQRATEGIVLL